MTVLKIMCGAPGSGKSTYVKNHARPEDLVVSRDDIRFALLTPGIPYFSKEKEVFDVFCNRINAGIGHYNVVWADATHLNNYSRWKLLYNIFRHDFEKIEFICIETPLEKCLENNLKRERKYQVPEDALKSMYSRYMRPSINDFLSLNVSIKVVK